MAKNDLAIRVYLQRGTIHTEIVPLGFGCRVGSPEECDKLAPLHGGAFFCARYNPHRDQTAWLPFLDTYRTMCLAPDQPFRSILETGGELKSACEHIVRELLDGVKHGFFEMTITVETVRSKKKCITIKGGRSHRFIA